MLRKSIQTSAGEPSFFYLMMAESCFQRAVSTRHPKARGTLHEIGRRYLAQASEVASALEPRSLESASNHSAA
ncbi:MAG TPA: hypothetical protein VIY51_16020 [Xanthobacteraceae bacterium]